MNVRLQYDLAFLGAIWLDSQLQLNSYNANLQIVTASTNQAMINVAMERLKCFVHSVLADSVFINQKYKEVGQVLQAMGANITTLPDEPVDQIIGMMLYCKLNSIMEGVLRVTSIDISSTIGDDVWYQHDEEDLLGPFSQDGWWFNSSTQHDTLELYDDESEPNVVKVAPNGWIEYGLMWPEPESDNHSNTVVYANFSKNENQPVR